MSDFVHLHNHTEFSSLDGAQKLKNMIAHAVKMGHEALAITDHGSGAGWYKFAAYCREAGIKPIIGIEAYLTVGGRSRMQTSDDYDIVESSEEDGDFDPSQTESQREKSATKKKYYEHITLIAMNETGWRNIVKMVNETARSYRYKPRMDYDLLEQHSEGIICLTGCLAGPVLGYAARAGLEPARIERKVLTLTTPVKTERGTRETPFATLMREYDNLISKGLVKDGDLPSERALEGKTVAFKKTFKPVIDDFVETWKQIASDYLVPETPRTGVTVNLDEDGAIGKRRRVEMIHQAEANLRRIIDIFGEDRTFVEVMEHGIEFESDALPILAKLADRNGVRMVATNDAHYTEEHEAGHHDTLLNMQRDGFSFNGSGYFLRTGDQMRELRDEDWWAEACDNSLVVADMCEDIVPVSDGGLPEFPMVRETHHGEIDVTQFEDTPQGHRALLREIVRTGMARKGHSMTDVLRARLNHEFKVVGDKGFIDYYLMVWDLLLWARANGIYVGMGRGSVAGSAAAYYAEISWVDPIEEILYFERFLEANRADYPDMDLDFEQRRRGEVIAYIGRKYGKDYVARIGTLRVAASKSVVKDVVRVYGGSPTFANALTKLIPMDGAKPRSLNKFVKQPDAEKFLAEWEKLGDHAEEALITALAIEGTVIGESIHACGTLISNRPLVDLIPLRKDTKKSLDEANVTDITQWEAKDIESYGLLKLDILGLRNLDVVSDAVRNIRDNRGEEIDIYYGMPDPNDLSDPRVARAYSLFSDGRTAGVFQMECVSGDTQVGGRSIKSLFDQQEAGNPKNTLISVLLDEGRFVRNRVNRIFKTGTKETFRLVTDSDRMIEATAGHKFMTRDGWRTLGELSPGDELLVDPRARKRVHRECGDCGKFTNSDSANASDRCYSCSATFHANPARSGDAISEGIIRSYLEGRKPWNTGLTTETSSVVAATGKKISLSLAGKTLEQKVGAERANEIRAKNSQRMSGEGNHMFGKPSSGSKMGYREDLGHFVRSTWEADFARVLNLLEIEYEYEKETFPITLPDGTKTTYTPDFWIPSQGRFVEVKGWYTKKNHIKMVAFLDQHPDVPVVVLERVAFAEMSLAFKDKIEWECPQKPDRMVWETVSRIIPAGVQDTYDISMAAPAHNYIANGFMVHNSSGITELARRLRPDCFGDLSALIALYRPGPMGANMHTMYADRKNGREEVDYSIYTADVEEQKWIERVLGITYGTFVYQEQLMDLGTLFAGFDAIWRNKLRKATAKKLPEMLEEVGKEWFANHDKEFFDSEGTMISPKFSRQTAEVMWQMMQASAEYLFNKAHSAAYGLLTYITAYLKANYPAEYGAAILSTTDTGKADKRRAAFAALRDEGIEILPPDVNASRARTFPHTDSSVIIGLAEIKGVGAAGSAVASERHFSDLSKPFRSLHDMVNRVVDTDGKAILSVADLGGLIEAGACDSITDGYRKGAMIVSRASKDADIPVPPMEWGVVERSARQRAKIGVGLGENPLTTVKDQLRAWRVPDERRFGDGGGGGAVSLSAIPHEADLYFTTIGILSGYTERSYAGGTAKLAGVMLEGTNTSIEGVMFQRALNSLDFAPSIGQIVAASGFTRVNDWSPPKDDDDDAQPDDLEEDEGGTVEEVESRLELSINRMWAVDLVDEHSGDLYEAELTWSAAVEEYEDSRPEPDPEDDTDPDGDDDPEGSDDDDSDDSGTEATDETDDSTAESEFDESDTPMVFASAEPARRREYDDRDIPNSEPWFNEPDPPEPDDYFDDDDDADDDEPRKSDRDDDDDEPVKPRARKASEVEDFDFESVPLRARDDEVEESLVDLPAFSAPRDPKVTPIYQKQVENGTKVPVIWNDGTSTDQSRYSTMDSDVVRRFKTEKPRLEEVRGYDDGLVVVRLFYRQDYATNERTLRYVHVTLHPFGDIHPAAIIPLFDADKGKPQSIEDLVETGSNYRKETAP